METHPRARRRHRHGPAKERADWTLAYLIAGAIGLVALLALATAPTAVLLGDSRYAIPSALHGVSSFVYLIIATLTAFLALRLYSGRLRTYRDLRILAGLQAFFSLLTILFGNWIYIYYRASEGPRSFFLETNPALHQIFFEFKEFAALFTLPLAVAAAAVLWRERDAIGEDRPLRQAVAVLLMLSWVFMVITFALGAAITKIRSV